MEQYFRALYDENLAFESYMFFALLEGSLNEAIVSLCPLVRMVVSKYVRDDHGNRSEIETDALEEVYRVVADKSLPDHPHPFTRYLSTVIRRAIADSFKRTAPQHFDYWRVCRFPHESPFTSAADVNNKIYSEQIRGVIRSKVRERIRFIDSHLDACRFILECHLGYINLDPSVARRRFKLTTHESKYFQRYITILTKAVLLELRDHERTLSTIAPQWEASGDVLRTVS